jgi:hypothetical protein
MLLTIINSPENVSDMGFLSESRETPTNPVHADIRSNQLKATRRLEKNWPTGGKGGRKLLSGAIPRGSGRYFLEVKSVGNSRVQKISVQRAFALTVIFHHKSRYQSFAFLLINLLSPPDQGSQTYAGFFSNEPEKPPRPFAVGAVRLFRLRGIRNREIDDN